MTREWGNDNYFRQNRVVGMPKLLTLPSIIPAKLKHFLHSHRIERLDPTTPVRLITYHQTRV